MNDLKSLFYKGGEGKRLLRQGKTFLGQIYTREIFRVFGRVVIDLFVIWGMILLVHFALLAFNGLPECSSYQALKGESARCIFHWSFLLRTVVYCSAIMLGSFLCTRYHSFLRTERSMMDTAVLLLSLVIILFRYEHALLLIGVELLLVFLAMFSGYRLAFSALSLVKNPD